MNTLALPMDLVPVLKVGHPHMLPGMTQPSLRLQATRMAGLVGMMVTVVMQTRTLGMGMEA